jgi:hypothetical protein
MERTVIRHGVHESAGRIRQQKHGPLGGGRVCHCGSLLGPKPERGEGLRPPRTTPEQHRRGTPLGNVLAVSYLAGAVAL